MAEPKAEPELREPVDADWPAILALANRSVEAVLGAGRQDDWLRNRQRACPVRRHAVAVDAGEVVGYAALEWQPSYAEKSYRLFVVTAPDELARLGPPLYRRLEGWLAELGAVNAWMVEYADDEPLFAFAAALGFREARRFRLGSGVECVVVGKRLAGGAP